MKTLNVTFDDDDFKELEKIKNSLKLTWGGLISMIAYPEIQEKIKEIKRT